MEHQNQTTPNVGTQQFNQNLSDVSRGDCSPILLTPTPTAEEEGDHATENDQTLTTTDKEAIFATIISQANKEENDEQWLL